MSNLTGNLSVIGAQDIWDSLYAFDLKPQNVNVDNVKKLKRVIKTIEEIKLPAVKFAFLVCSYKEKVTSDLNNKDAAIFRNVQYSIETKSSESQPSNFLEKNMSHSNGQGGCDETILRAIMMSYNSIIASSRLFDFVDDLHDLKEREREIKKAIESP
jgi:hypothetical protein